MSVTHQPRGRKGGREGREKGREGRKEGGREGGRKGGRKNTSRQNTSPTCVILHANLHNKVHLLILPTLMGLKRMCSVSSLAKYRPRLLRTDGT